MCSVLGAEAVAGAGMVAEAPGGETVRGVIDLSSAGAKQAESTRIMRGGSRSTCWKRAVAGEKR